MTPQEQEQYDLFNRQADRFFCDARSFCDLVEESENRGRELRNKAADIKRLADEREAQELAKIEQSLAELCGDLKP